MMMMINIWISGGRCIFVRLSLALTSSPKCQSSHKLAKRGLNADKADSPSFSFTLLNAVYSHLLMSNVRASTDRVSAQSHYTISTYLC